MNMKDLLKTAAKVGIAVIAVRLLGSLLVIALIIWAITALLTS